MIQVSDISNVAPATFKTELQKAVYYTFSRLGIGYERVDIDEVITMVDCIAINDRLDIKMVKTLFLTNRQQTVQQQVISNSEQLICYDFLSR